jgi:hypothetical protein
VATLVCRAILGDDSVIGQVYNMGEGLLFLLLRHLI